MRLENPQEYLALTNNCRMMSLKNSGRMVKESSITGTFKAFCNYVGVEYKPSHTCRRSYVTNCLDKGMKLALISKNVGHMNKRLRLIVLKAQP